MPEKEYISVIEKFEAKTKREPAAQADVAADDPAIMTNAGGDPPAAARGKYDIYVTIASLSKINKPIVEFSGIESAVELIPQYDDSSKRVQMLPGKASFSEVTLKWKVSPDLEMYEWYRKTLLGEIRKMNILITLYSREDNFFAYWYLVDAWPCAYKGPALYSPDRGDPIESVTFVCKDVVRIQ
jgi:phage tail-like protein